MPNPIFCLIVDDEPFIVDFIKTALGSLDLQLATAEHGRKALEIFSQGNIVDILVTDLNMPIMPGDELIRHIREISPQTLILVLTGYSSISSAVSLMKQGIFDYLTKPIEIGNLIESVQRAMQEVENLRRKNISGNLPQFWRISQWMGKSLAPDKLLYEVLETGLKIMNANTGALYLLFLDEQWQESALINTNFQEIAPILDKLKPFIASWGNQRQEDIIGNRLAIIPHQKRSWLIAPFVEDKHVVAVMSVGMSTEISAHVQGLLAVFCSQISPIVGMSIRILKLLHAHEEAIKASNALEKVHEELKQSTKLACIGELAAGIIHDINTPLTCIAGFLQLFLRFLDKPDVTLSELLLVRNYLQQSLNETQRCQEIVRNLLTFSRKESKVFQPFALVEVVNRCFTLLAKQFDSNNISTICSMPTTLPKIMGNANQIQQVLMNLLVNAKNAMPQGGKITISAEESTDKIKISISDTGKGIPEENLTKIFEPFFTTNPTGKGTGLGLSISKKIIQEHGGEITVSSQINVGTVFTILLSRA